MKTLLITLATLFCFSCSNNYPNVPYQQPENIGDGLTTGALEEVGIDSQLILNASGKILEGKYGEIHSMLIFKDDKLVVEEYFPGHVYQWDAPYYHGEGIQWSRDRMHIIMSCTKSFTSACIGIAIDHGFIDNVQQSIFDYLPEYGEYATAGKESITIEHLLTMTAGLEWNEWSAAHGTTANDIDRIYFECSDDPLKCILERPMAHTPGEYFNYSGGNMILLGEILRNATGMNMIDFSDKYLFQPMEVDSVSWYQYANGVVSTDGTTYMTPRAMLKFGVLYLNNGVWNGTPLLSSHWVEKSATAYGNNTRIKIPIEDSGRNDYGYTWWITEVGSGANKTKMYRANGWGGQCIMVFPEKNMVVVFTSGNYAGKSSLFSIVEQYILPSL